MGHDEVKNELEPVTRRLIPTEVPLLDSREVVLFPDMIAPLIIRDPSRVQAVDAALTAGHKVVVIFGVKQTDGPASDMALDESGPAELDGVSEEPTTEPDAALTSDALYPVGTAAHVMRTMRAPDGTLQLLVSGIGRVGLQDLVQTEPYTLARVHSLNSPNDDSIELKALRQNVVSLFRKAVDLSPSIPDEVLPALQNISDSGQLADFVASQFNLSFSDRQLLLSEVDLLKRFDLLHRLLHDELEILELRQKIQSQAAGSMGKAQREYMLRQQMEAIRKELGEGSDEDELEDLRQQVQEAAMPEEAMKEAERELSRMEKMNAASPDYMVSRTYLDWMVELPWSKTTDDDLDVNEAERILDEDHYGLEKPKDRVLEYLSVLEMKRDMRGPILLLVGPPGTGKTSLGRSIARSMSREFVRMSLGGVRDEAEIRGHRRTYVGAMPGRIIQSLRRVGTRNPVFMLDEIDKLGSDFRGDPSSALLEVLDPAQNNSFVDHYLDVPFDLSNVLFIATANSYHSIPSALLDRMEVLELSGYTEAEKLEIARRYLVPRQLEAHGLSPKKLEIDDDALKTLIGNYTREAGLRNLEREIGSLARKAARQFAQGRRRKIRIQQKHLFEYLGSPRYHHEVAEESDEVGVATGLAWTPVGGDVLFVEAQQMPGRGNLNLTGQVGDVMKESAYAAMTYIRSRYDELGLEERFDHRRDVHVHVPAGAVPKDGPSAGITMATVLASAFTGRAIHKDVAMTGEITLRGKVLPIGGVRDKVLAAHRAGIKTVILPEDNRRDLDEIPETVRNDLRIVFASHMDDVLEVALQKPKNERRKREAKPKRRTAVAGATSRN